MKTRWSFHTAWTRSGPSRSVPRTGAKRKEHSFPPAWRPGQIDRGRVKTRRVLTIEQSKIYRDFFDFECSKAPQKRTKQARVKTRGSFYTASTQSGPSAPLGRRAAPVGPKPRPARALRRAGGSRRSRRRSAFPAKRGLLTRSPCFAPSPRPSDDAFLAVADPAALQAATGSAWSTSTAGGSTTGTRPVAVRVQRRRLPCRRRSGCAAGGGRPAEPGHHPPAARLLELGLWLFGADKIVDEADPALVFLAGDEVERAGRSRRWSPRQKRLASGRVPRCFPGDHPFPPAGRRYSTSLNCAFCSSLSDA